MTTYPLHHLSNHLYLEHDGLWLIGTGAPASFGATGSLSLDGRLFNLPSSFSGLTAEVLSRHVGVQCQGLLGANILGHFDHIFEVPNGRITLSQEENEHPGTSIPLSFVMGIPIVTATIAGQAHKMFLETGAQISYFQDPALATFPDAGLFQDFYPGQGPFQTNTHTVPMSLGGIPFQVRCGSLPPALSATLMNLKTKGLIGNAILHHRTAAYQPRRSRLVL